jgi:hypothetical protein
VGPHDFSTLKSGIVGYSEKGLTGIGEGGSKDTVEQAGAMLIGEDPSRIDRLWQMLFRGYFYPPGVEVDFSRLRLASDIRQRYSPTPMFRRPDGSFTNWD